MTVGSESAPFESPKTPDGKQDVKKAVQGQGKTVEKQWKGSEKAPIIAVGETVILLHPPLPSAGVSIGMERGASAQ